MPLYEYKCGECGQIFEVRQNFADAPLTTHENCGGAVQRLISAPALQFKGSGWYITDYARGGTSGNKDAKSDGKTETKTDSSKSDSSSGSSTSTPSTSSTDSKTK
jgi:putative FmdB family regulatory protein